MEDKPVKFYPAHMKTLRIPNDSALRRAYEVYKPSVKTIQLLSEQNRRVYPELFIENDRLGTLKDLSTAVLARSFSPAPLPIVAENPLLLQVHYDALDVDLPLSQCYHVREERYWKRVVLAKHQDKTLAIKPDINYKNLGVSLKFVELVEQCSVEYWPAEEMKQLAIKTKEFVQEMHIKHLQSLKEEEETNEKLTEKTESYLRLEVEVAAKKDVLKKQRLHLTEASGKAREAKQEKRQQREATRLAKEKPDKKPLKKIPDNIFNIIVSDSEDESDNNILDKRNKQLYLCHKKKYDYPAEDCHHIDLKFVQYFTNLEIFTLEFWGPLMGRHFHKRHQRFSLDDIKNLSVGLTYLSKLKIFRLRNSFMDADKCQTLCQALAGLPCLKTLDFGCDQLKDDCALIFEQLLEVTRTLQSLELEFNFFGEQTLNHIGRALKNNNATELSYLGLARNPLTDKALHGLVTQIMGTHHVQHLNIRGVHFLTEHGICCCLANELLRKHLALKKLDICAVQVSSWAADEIVKSLVENNKILEFDCTNCGLDLETEIDINVLLKRNQYILEHNYLGDPTVTVEEISKWLNRSRNPILLKVLAERKAAKKCFENRFQESNTYSNSNTALISHHDSLELQTQLHERKLPEHSSSEIQIPAETNERLVHSVNDFDEEEFLKHVYQPGPQDRYYYFKTCQQKY